MATLVIGNSSSGYGSVPDVYGGTSRSPSLVGTKFSVTSTDGWLIQSLNNVPVSGFGTSALIRGALWDGGGSPLSLTDSVSVSSGSSAPTSTKSFTFNSLNHSSYPVNDSGGYYVPAGNYYIGIHKNAEGTMAWGNDTAKTTGSWTGPNSVTEGIPELTGAPSIANRARAITGSITYLVVTKPSAPISLSYTTLALNDGATITFQNPGTRIGNLDWLRSEYSINGGTWTSIGKTNSFTAYFSQSATISVRHVTLAGNGTAASITAIGVNKPVINSLSASADGLSISGSFSIAQPTTSITVTRSDGASVSSTSSSFSDTASNYSSSYTYTVTAINAAGTTTAQVSVTSGPAPTLTQSPVWQNPTSVTNTSMRLLWTPAIGQNGTIAYKIERALDANFSSGLTAVLNWGTGSTSGSFKYVDVTGLSAQTQYYFRIQARISDPITTVTGTVVTTTDPTYNTEFYKLFSTTGGRTAYYLNGTWIPVIPQTWDSTTGVLKNTQVYYHNGTTWVLNTL